MKSGDEGGSLGHTMRWHIITDWVDCVSGHPEKNQTSCKSVFFTKRSGGLYSSE